MSEEKRLLDYVLSTALEGDPNSVIKTIDQYAGRYGYLIHIGEVKRRKVEQVVNESQVKRILELGTNFGYSAMVMANQLIPGEGNVITIEFSKFMAKIAYRMIQFAGLSDRIQIINGNASKAIPRLKPHFDLVFLDHEKDHYLKDLKLIEKYGLIHDGSIVLADNTGMYRHGLQSYFDHVRSSGRYVSQTLEGANAFDEEIWDAMELSIHINQ